MSDQTVIADDAGQLPPVIARLRNTARYSHERREYFYGVECACGQPWPCEWQQQLLDDADAVAALLDERDALRVRVAELEAVDPETAAEIKVADAIARYKAGRYCPDCGNPKTSLAHGTRCLSATKETT